MDEDKKEKKPQKISINVATEQLKEALKQVVENSGLPIANVYYVWQFLGHDLEYAYLDALNSEAPEIEVTKEIKRDQEEESEEN